MVDVEGVPEPTRLDALQIGDKVRVEDDEYSMIYSFGHYDKTTLTPYRQVHLSKEVMERPLEITADHLVYVQQKASMVAVPAKDLQVGDSVLLGNQELANIVKIETVTRRGAYAPITLTGNIVVSNVLASNYISMIELKEDDNDMKKWMFDHQHWVYHMFIAPRRILCSFGMEYCKNTNEIYEKDTGIATWASPLIRFVGEWGNDQHPVLQIVLFGTAMIMLWWMERAILLLDWLLHGTPMLHWILLGCGLGYLWKTANKTSDTVILEKTEKKD